MDKRVKELVERLASYKKLPITHPEYITDHFAYLHLEAECDEAVEEYFRLTGRGKLTDGKSYFK
jgi:hypothetical protein